MFARTIARTAVRSSSKPSNGGSALAKRGVATSSGPSKLTTSKTASLASSVVALAAGGVVIGHLLGGDSKKLHLEASAKRKSYSDRMIAKEKGGENSQSGERKKEDQSKAKNDEAPSNISGEQKEQKEEVEEAAPMDMEDLSEDASQQSAFDPETNTINWDCPCLGGMAQGPCGEEFKSAFSCFVFSEEEVKGVDCIDKFKAMQDCFRKYPDHYKEELEDEDEFERSEQEREAQENGNSNKKDSSNSDPSNTDEDEAVREWRAEMEKEGKN